jgi:hypothetical protein
VREPITNSQKPIKPQPSTNPMRPVAATFLARFRCVRDAIHNVTEPPTRHANAPGTMQRESRHSNCNGNNKIASATKTQRSSANPIVPKQPVFARPTGNTDIPPEAPHAAAPSHP